MLHLNREPFHGVIYMGSDGFLYLHRDIFTKAIPKKMSKLKKLSDFNNSTVKEKNMLEELWKSGDAPWKIW